VLILYIEDEPLVQQFVADLLGLEGWAVELCASGTSALARITGDQSYDLILTDNDVPGVSGLALVQQIRALRHRCHLPVIVFSAGEYETDAYAAGADLYLRKPEDTGKLADCIKHLIGSESIGCKEKKL
jgi:CheY-like chemotaxis protein